MLQQLAHLYRQKSQHKYEQMNSWDILIVLRYDRITRNSNKRIDYLQKLKAANKEIFSVTEPEINGSYFDMFNALNEHYRGRK